jgi:hypothetical protein
VVVSGELRGRVWGRVTGLSRGLGLQ